MYEYVCICSCVTQNVHTVGRLTDDRMPPHGLGNHCSITAQEHRHWRHVWSDTELEVEDDTVAALAVSRHDRDAGLTSH